MGSDAEGAHSCRRLRLNPSFSILANSLQTSSVRPYPHQVNLGTTELTTDLTERRERPGYSELWLTDARIEVAGKEIQDRVLRSDTG
jgi:hypothetical protein